MLGPELRFRSPAERDHGRALLCRQARDARGNSVAAHSKGPAIVSLKSCIEGQNLQWAHDNLFMQFLPKGDILEQGIGRTHRDGQQADEVTVTFPLTVREQYTGLAQAIRDAGHIAQTMQTPQKLCYGTLDAPTVEGLLHNNVDPTTLL